MKNLADLAVLADPISQTSQQLKHQRWVGAKNISSLNYEKIGKK